LKFPIPVRKVRKYRKTLRSKSTPKITIIGRDLAFKSAYNQNLGKSASDLRLRRSPPKISPSKQELNLDKLKSKSLSQELDSEELIDKSLEKKEELDEIVKDSVEGASK
ncbi:MAG: hypothetical protein ACFFE5_15400, partial [Candidatus Thorarchaeota archaeon]